MLNYVYFSNKRADDVAKLAKLMATEDISELSGIAFVVSPDDIDEGNFADIDAVLNAVPSNFRLKIGMPASSLSPAKSYSFKTETVLNGAAAMTVPVLSDPAFFSWLLSQWLALQSYLQSKGAASRLGCLGIAPIGNFPGDGQFHIPGALASTPVENSDFWAALGVTHETVPGLMAGFLQSLMDQPVFAGCNFVVAVLCPYNDYLGSVGQGDSGRAYTALETALQAVKGAGTYVVMDQGLMGDERSIIRDIAADHPYACQIAAMPAADTAKILAAYQVARSYAPIWIELQTYQIAMVTTWLKS